MNKSKKFGFSIIIAYVVIAIIFICIDIYATKNGLIGRAKGNAANVVLSTKVNPSSVTWTLTTNKAVYKVGETVTAKLTLKNISVDPVTYNFGSESQAELFAVGTGDLYDSRKVVKAQTPSQFVLNGGSSKEFIFTFKASTQGRYTLTSYIDGSSDRVTTNIGVGLQPLSTQTTPNITTLPSINNVYTDNAQVVTGTPTERFCSPNGTYHLVMDLKVSTNKTVYKTGENVTATVTLTDPGTQGQTSLAFTCSSEAQLVVNGLYDSRNNPVISQAHSVVMQGSASSKLKTKSYTFTFPAKTKGAFTVNAYIQGYDKLVSINIGVDTDVVSKPMVTTDLKSDTDVINITHSDIGPYVQEKNNLVVATSTSAFPTLKTGTQIYGPIPSVNTATTSTSTTTTTIVLPPVIESHGLDPVTFMASDLASYSKLPALFRVYASSSASQADKVTLLALADAITAVLSETSSSDWASADLSPNTLMVELSPVSSASLATKKSFMASVFTAIKSIFVADAYEPISLRWKVDNIGVANNTCVRYFDIFTEDSIAEIGPFHTSEELKAFMESPNRHWSSNLFEFKKGICGVFSAYQSLKDFDVSAALNEAEYKTKHAASPYDNSGYYRGTYINFNTMNSDIKKSNIELSNYSSTSPKDNLAKTSVSEIANLHTAFNDFGPADFECGALNLGDENTASDLKTIKKSCKSDLTFIYGITMTNSKQFGHAEHVTKVDYASSSKLLTLETDDGFSQGSVNYKFMHSARDKNKYVMKLDKETLPALTSVTLPVFKTSTKIAWFGGDQKLNPFSYAVVLVCTDKSDVIRTAPPLKQYQEEYTHTKQWIDFMIKGSTAAFTASLNGRVPGPGEAPNFSSCNKDNITAASAVLESRLPAFYKKWNDAAYDNRGYVSTSTKNQLLLERASIYDDAEKLIPDYACVKSHLREWDFSSSEKAWMRAWQLWTPDINNAPECKLSK